MTSGPPRLRQVPPPDAPDDEDPDQEPEGSDAYGVPAASGRRRAMGLLERGPGRSDVILRMLLLFAVSAVAALLVGPKLVGVELPSDEGFLGKRARVHVRADRDYALVDEETTSERREQAWRESRSVWDLDLARAQTDAQLIGSALGRLEDALSDLKEAARGERPGKEGEEPGSPPLPDNVAQRLEAQRARLAGDLALIGAEAPRDEAWRGLLEVLWRAPDAKEVVTGVLADALSAPVVGDRALLARDEAWGIVIRAVPAALGHGERVIERIEEVRTLKEAKRALEERLPRRLEDATTPLSATEAVAVATWASGLLRTTLTYNATESDARRRAAAEAVRAEVVRVHRGEMVLRPGEVITPRHLLVLKAMELQQGEQMRTRAALGSGAFVLLLCLVVYRFGVRGVFHRSLALKDLVVIAGLLVLTLLLGLLADRLIAPVTERLPEIPPLALVCAVPVAWGAMQTRLLMSSEVALLFALLGALLGGVMAEPGTTWTIAALVSSMAGAALVGRMERRPALLLAGLGAGFVGAAAAVTLEVFRGALAEEQLFWLGAACVAGGILSGAFALVATPLAEGLLGYVTDLKLVSLADLNQPLLKDLIVHAPGTWHHSMRVARLAEAAARVVGANERLTRVISLYHDVGKIQQPQYFAENLQGRDNPHDRLEPDASARILKEHVSHGVELTRRHRLPRVVVRAIAEHHADFRMELFYEKARAAADVSGAAPADAGYRYGGPSPRSRESAIVMLADQMEAASRALADSSPERLADVVDHFVDRAIRESALAASDLTFRDLERARQAFWRTLVQLHEAGPKQERSDPPVAATEPA